MTSEEIAKEVEPVLLAAAEILVAQRGKENVPLDQWPDRLRMLCKDSAARLGMLFEGRLLPMNNHDFDPDALFEETLATLTVLFEAKPVADANDYYAATNVKRSTVEILGHVAMLGDHRFAKAVALLYSLLERVNGLLRAYEDRDPHEVFAGAEQ